MARLGKQLRVRNKQRIYSSMLGDSNSIETRGGDRDGNG
jgi:hypothetical protein